MINNSKLILGGAQFGMSYGSSSKSKKIDFKALSKILTIAHKKKINAIDTASAYGVSEKRVGDYLSNNIKKKFKIYTKIPKINNIEKKSKKKIHSIILKSVDNSLNFLNVKYLEGLAVHNVSDFLKKKKIYLDCINFLKKEKIIRNFGISIYTPAELKKIARIKEITFIQMPINILDNRWDKNYLIKLKKKGIKIFARSIFLRGLLFFKKNQKWPCSKFEQNKIKIYIKQITKKYYKKNIIDLTFSYLNSLTFLSGIVFGFNSIKQFKQINSFKDSKKLDINQNTFLINQFKFVNKKILDGRNY